MGTQSRSLQQTFFAQRNVTKIPGINIKQLALPIRSVAIIGAGLMGGGIAMCFAQKGIEVFLKDLKQEQIDKGIQIIKKNWLKSCRKGRWSIYQIKKFLELIKPTINYNNFKKVDMVIEAAYENLNIKRTIFKSLNKICKSRCILATNTSTLDIDKIAEVCSYPEKVIGMHFFSPANVMKLLENVKGTKTSKTTIATVSKIGKFIGKIPVLVGNCFGFVGNRIIFAYTSMASRLVEEGCSPYEIDSYMKDFGMAMGPFQMSDLSGLDVGYKIRTENGTVNSKEHFYSFTVGDILHEQGCDGQKTKKGYYDYSKSKRGKPRKETIDLIELVRKNKNITQRTFDKKTIQERLIFSIINEAMLCLEEGIAMRPIDVDIILIFGYGFPPQKGGPLFYCDQIGISKVYSKIKKFSSELPNNPYWKPSILFKKCFTKNIQIHKYYNQNLKNNLSTKL